MARPKVTLYLLFITLAICLGSMQFGFHLVTFLSVPVLVVLINQGRDELPWKCYVLSNKQESDCRLTLLAAWLYPDE